MSPNDTSPAIHPSLPLVSVCIANYNGMEVIDDCIQSILNQTGSIPLEILVHDDASTDDSVGHIKARYPDVKLIESQNNVGFCIANNRMAAVARGDYLLLLNDDATLQPDALSALLQEAQQLAQPAILTLPQYDADTGRLLDIGSLLDPFFSPVPNLDPRRGEVGSMHGACLWVNRWLWQELGGFPEWFGSIAEDLYLCCRARLAGCPVRALGRSGYGHRVGRSFGGGKVADGKLTTTFRRRALSERNRTFVMAITCPTPVVYFLLPLHLLLQLAEGTLLSLLRLDVRYFFTIYLAAVVAVVQHHHLLRTERRKISRIRRLASTDFFKVFVRVPHKLRMLWRHGLPQVR